MVEPAEVERGGEWVWPAVEIEEALVAMAEELQLAVLRLAQVERSLLLLEVEQESKTAGELLKRMLSLW